MKTTTTVPAPEDGAEQVPNYWLRSLRRSSHLDAEALDRALKVAGLTQDTLREAGTLLPLHREVAVLEALAKHSSDPIFALRLGQTAETRTGSVLSYILFSSPTVRKALSNMCEFSRITRPRSRVELIDLPGAVEFRMAHPDPRVQLAGAHREFVLASILNSLRTATRSELRPERVLMPSPIGRRREHLARALGCPVDDAGGYMAFVLSTEALDRSVRSGDECLLQHLTDYGRILLRERRPAPETTREQVYRYLMCRLTGGVPKLADVAQALAVSERTLARRLTTENTSYREMVDHTRATMASALLDDPGLSLTEISYLLGFSDQSSFTHAFRRWTGLPPKSARPVAAGGK